MLLPSGPSGRLSTAHMQLMWEGIHGMSTPTDSLTDPLAYAPKLARDAAIAEQRNAAKQDRVSKRNESPDDAWPTEWSPAARSVDPIVLQSLPQHVSPLQAPCCRWVRMSARYSWAMASSLRPIEVPVLIDCSPSRQR
jgi:hypothetical protein